MSRPATPRPVDRLRPAPPTLRRRGFTAALGLTMLTGLGGLTA